MRSVYENIYRNDTGNLFQGDKRESDWSQDIKLGPITLETLLWILSKLSRYTSGAQDQTWEQYLMNERMVDL